MNKIEPALVPAGSLAGGAGQSVVEIDPFRGHHSSISPTRWTATSWTSVEQRA